MTDTNADMDVTPGEQPIVVEKRDDGIIRPGDLSAKLQACRERADLDQEQAAIAMRLSPAMIKALESENFAELPDPPYVRGYLRSYARLDESNPQDLIRCYEVLRGADPDSLNTPPPITLTRVHKPSISPTTVRMLGLVALVLLLGVLSMIPGINQWVKQTWQSFAAAQPGSAPALIATQKAASTTTTTPSTGTSTDLTATQATPSTSSPALATTTQDSPVSTTGSELVQPTPSATAGTSTGSTTDSASTSVGMSTPTSTTSTASTTTPTTLTTTEPMVIPPTATDTTATTTLANATPDPSAPSTATASTNPSSSPTATAATTTTAPVTGTTDPAATTPVVDPNKPLEAVATTQQPIDGEVTVRMEFTQEVWMQVKDGSNKSIFESLNSPNTWKQFKTRTPLTFKIGNAPGVKLYLNGQAYDHAKYTRGSVARFTVN